MQPDKAYAILEQATSKLQADRNTHAAIAMALQVFKSFIKAEQPKKEAVKVEEKPTETKPELKTKLQVKTPKKRK